MSGYTETPFALIPGPDGWTATVALAFELGEKGSGLWLVAPADYVSDGPSIPWWARGWINPDDPRLQKAARLHDVAIERGWTAWSSTAVLYDAMRADGVSAPKRWAMAIAVLVFQVLKRG
ncbi:DUF1353 domain-containing protein [Aurantimonas sp. MSK8Z-1]|uniref:DUF1353 domain-containing protein n=1 Tax=Mangrovibrevibacter kandeliae TaxID=2968473 RepID=UPI002117AC13|nr:DUF1353 domain-containing protein [Aurantimonas sp. MSK8Z-1]MCW4114728.1 DUF1353 domain-containing protein [Aurantimonas sp. MSK8Z-1]